MLTYKVWLAKCLNSVINVKVLVGAFSVIVKSLFEAVDQALVAVQPRRRRPSRSASRGSLSPRAGRRTSRSPDPRSLSIGSSSSLLSISENQCQNETEETIAG